MIVFAYQPITDISISPKLFLCTGRVLLKQVFLIIGMISGVPSLSTL